MTTIPYGEHPDQVADLLLPGGEGPFPVALLIHGGFWRAGYDRSLMGPMARALATRGWASWNIEYRRGAGSGGPAGHAVGDVVAALGALGALDVPLDLGRLVLVGHSAGGHLALLAGAGSRARLVISLAGVADLGAAVAEDLGGGAAREFVGVDPETDPGAFAAIDPMAKLPSGVPVLLVHGDRDDRVPIAQSRAYLDAARAAGDPCELLELPGEDHFGIIDPTSGAFAAWADRLAAV
jgi:acetyl esterase/lipase